MCAPVIALVPTPNRGSCTSDDTFGAAVPDAVFNNMVALLVLAPACVIYRWVLIWVAPQAQEDSSEGA